MDSLIINYIPALSAWHWLAIAGILLVIEVLLPSSWLLGPAAASFIIGVSSTIFPALDWRVAVFGFSALSIIMTMLLRKTLKKSILNQPRTVLNKPGMELIGKHFMVFASDNNNGAQIKVGDTIWQVESDNRHALPVNAEVEVLGVSGTTLIVKRLS
ncbi:MAG: NfeD family protein [Alphaproteobacteria bacterium]